MNSVATKTPLEDYKMLCSECSDVLLFLDKVISETGESLTLELSERDGLSYILNHLGRRLLHAVDEDFSAV